jgi:hypothetical protein
MARKTVQTKFVSGNIARVDLAPFASNLRSAGLSKRAAIFELAWHQTEPGSARKVLTTRIEAW